MSRTAWLALLAVLALPGCQRAQTPAEPASDAAGSVAAVEGIQWFEGDLEAAFASAAAAGKPVFLYWGAEWCPPCHDLKAHVFSRRDFQEKLRQFVPVFLDGDAEGAQRIAGEFHVLGYPTAVVLDAGRAEIARIAGGMDLALYADVLDLALDNARPLPDVLQGLRADQASRLDAADCRRMAYNGWTLDPEATADPAALLGWLELAAERCPQDAVVERDRLLLTAAGIAAEHELDDVQAGRPASARLVRLVDGTTQLLGDESRVLANADALLSLGDEFFVVVRSIRPGRVAGLRAQWFSLMDALEANEQLADTERLFSAASRLRVAQALSADETISPAVAGRARDTLDAFLARSYEADARAGIVNSASWVLSYLGDDARLKTLLEGELRSSRTPYYYMPDLADLEEKAGRPAEALDWLERGYRESKGPATRFQWGVLYVEGLLRMSPGDEDRIREATLAVVGELDGPDRIHARALQRLSRLREKLHAWSEAGTDRTATLDVLAQRWQGICASLPAGDPVRGQCPGLLTAPGA